MEGEIRGREHFFKVMMPGFEQTLNLPEALSKKLKLQKSVEAVVKSRTGEWKMEMRRNQELGLICFKDGWPSFVQGHGLMIGDFVVFEHIANFHFNAVVFGINACEKDYFVADPKKHPKDAPKKNKKGCTASGISFTSKNPFFILTMKHYHAAKKSLVNVPERFWRLNDIGEETSMVLRDPSRRKWPVKLHVNRMGQDRCWMKSGWHDFYVANELKMGDVCAFELIIRKKSDNVVVMDVHIFPAPS